MLITTVFHRFCIMSLLLSYCCELLIAAFNVVENRERDDFMNPDQIINRLFVQTIICALNGMLKG